MRTTPAVLGLLVLTACGKDRPPAAPALPPVSAAELQALLAAKPKALVAAVLEACHGPLKGRAEMGQVILELGQGTDAAQPDQVILAKGRRMRLKHSDGEVEIAGPRAHWRAVPDTGLQAVEGEAAARLDRLQQLLRACLLAPLYSAREISRGKQPAELLLRRGKELWTLQLRGLRRADKSISLVPGRLSGSPGEVDFLALRDTGVSVLPQRVRLSGFGERRIEIKATGAVFDPRVFDDPLGDQASQQPSGEAQRRLQDGGVAPDPGQVVLRHVPDRQVMLVEDPSPDWPARIELMNEAPRILGKQGQEAADLNYLFEEGGRRYIGFPFQRYDKPFVALPEQRILRRRNQKALIYYAPKGAGYEARVAAGKKALQEQLRQRGLRAAGPLRELPHLDEAAGHKVLPSASQLSEMPLRLELPVF